MYTMKKTVGIITFHASHNYGSMLQAYALQQVILSLGFECEIINFRTLRQKTFYKPIWERGNIFGKFGYQGHGTCLVDMHVMYLDILAPENGEPGVRPVQIHRTLVIPDAAHRRHRHRRQPGKLHDSRRELPRLQFSGPMPVLVDGRIEIRSARSRIEHYVLGKRIFPVVASEKEPVPFYTVFVVRKYPYGKCHFLLVVFYHLAFECPRIVIIDRETTDIDIPGILDGKRDNRTVEQKIGAVARHGDIFHVLYQKSHLAVSAVVVRHAQKFRTRILRPELVKACGKTYLHIPVRMGLQYFPYDRSIVRNIRVRFYDDCLRPAGTDMHGGKQQGYYCIKYIVFHFLNLIFAYARSRIPMVF